MYSSITIPRSILNRMFEYAESQFPLEVCGLLGGINNQISLLFPVENILKSPSEFHMEPQGQLGALLDIEASGCTLLAIFHSHPNGPNHPSEKDLASHNYPDTYSIILFRKNNEWKAKIYLIAGGNYAELALEINPCTKSDPDSLQLNTG